VEGKSYGEITSALGNHGRGAIRQSLSYSARNAYSRLLKYLNNEIRDKVRPELLKVNRRHMISMIISRSTVKWEEYKYSYKVFYFFVCHDG
jgi:hypothetical protein